MIAAVNRCATQKQNLTAPLAKNTHIMKRRFVPSGKPVRCPTSTQIEAAGTSQAEPLRQSENGVCCWGMVRLEAAPFQSNVGRSKQGCAGSEVRATLTELSPDLHWAFTFRLWWGSIIRDKRSTARGPLRCPTDNFDLRNKSNQENGTCLEKRLEISLRRSIEVSPGSTECVRWPGCWLRACACRGWRRLSPRNTRNMLRARRRTARGSSVRAR